MIKLTVKPDGSVEVIGEVRDLNLGIAASGQEMFRGKILREQIEVCHMSLAAHDQSNDKRWVKTQEQVDHEIGEWEYKKKKED